MLVEELDGCPTLLVVLGAQQAEAADWRQLLAGEQEFLELFQGSLANRLLLGFLLYDVLLEGVQFEPVLGIATE